LKGGKHILHPATQYSTPASIFPHSPSSSGLSIKNFSTVIWYLHAIFAHVHLSTISGAAPGKRQFISPGFAFPRFATAKDAGLGFFHGMRGDREGLELGEVQVWGLHVPVSSAELAAAKAGTGERRRMTSDGGRRCRIFMAFDEGRRKMKRKPRLKLR
jgi:hypothetical protein